ncbi:MAG: hypothetical protein II699_00200 [Lachnospiraceae bacterium]|nr:hypothetical protein [Lachnospiraceae bacterium]
MRKTVLKIVSIVLILGVIFTGVVTYGIHDYMLKNTWATLKVTGDDYIETSTDEDYVNPSSGIVVLEQEYLSHETIKICDTSLYIDKISHDGTIEFTVEDGQFKDESGKQVKKGVFKLGVESNFVIGSDTYTFTVTDNRYR